MPTQTRTQKRIAEAIISTKVESPMVATRKRAKKVDDSGAATEATLVANISTENHPKRPKVGQDGGTRNSATAKITSLPLKASPVPLLPPVLNFDLSAAYSHLSALDPRFSLFFKHLPCRPFVNLEAIDPFRTLVTSIIGQQVSWMAARAINGRFRELFGFSSGEEEGFPTPQMVLKKDVASLRSVGLSGRKVEYVSSLAEHFDSGKLSSHFLRNGSDEEIAKALISVRGIGQWTVDMFMIFSLRRPDVLSVGDLGVQKGLLKWALAAHGALEKKSTSGATPKKKKAQPKTEQVQDLVDDRGDGEVDTAIRATTPVRHVPYSSVPPTPSTPNGPSSDTGTLKAALHTPVAYTVSRGVKLPPTPATPSGIADEVAEVPPHTLPTPTTDFMISAPNSHPGWEPHLAAPLVEGLSVEVLKARLSGKKVKGGAYLTPKEMESLTAGWRPYRSLGVFYMWPVAGESGDQ